MTMIDNQGPSRWPETNEGRADQEQMSYYYHRHKLHRMHVDGCQWYWKRDDLVSITSAISAKLGSTANAKRHDDPLFSLITIMTPGLCRSNPARCLSDVSGAHPKPCERMQS